MMDPLTPEEVKQLQIEQAWVILQNAPAGGMYEIVKRLQKELDALKAEGQIDDLMHISALDRVIASISQDMSDYQQAGPLILDKLRSKR